jgi:hypothetical protein
VYGDSDAEVGVVERQRAIDAFGLGLVRGQRGHRRRDIDRQREVQQTAEGVRGASHQDDYQHGRERGSETVSATHRAADRRTTACVDQKEMPKVAAAESLFDEGIE